MMKARKYLFPIVLMILGVFNISCEKGKFSENEPNDRISKATYIELDNAISTDLSNENDVDYFRVSLPKQGYLQIDLLQTDNTVRISYFNSSGQIRSWQNLPDAAFIEAEGIYYFALKNELEKSAGMVSFLPKFLPEFDETEPNNTPETAYAVELDRTVKPAIFPRSDHDWFRIKLAEKGYLKVTADNVQRIRPEVYYLFIEEGISQRIRNWKYLPDACPIRTSGEYLIFLHDAYEDESSEKPIDLNFTFIPEFDDFEPNDDLKNAKTITLKEEINFSIFPKDDHDFFRLTDMQPGKLKVELTSEAELEIEVKFHIGKNSSNWQKFPAEVNYKEGDVYLEFRGFDDRCCAESVEKFIVTQ